jgi:hypothetical protein
LQQRFWLFEPPPPPTATLAACAAFANSFASTDAVAKALEGGRDSRARVDRDGNARGVCVQLAAAGDQADWRHVAFSRSRATASAWSRWLYGTQPATRSATPPPPPPTTTTLPLARPWEHRPVGALCLFVLGESGARFCFARMQVAVVAVLSIAVLLTK